MSTNGCQKNNRKPSNVTHDQHSSFTSNKNNKAQQIKTKF